MSNMCEYCTTEIGGEYKQLKEHELKLNGVPIALLTIGLFTDDKCKPDHYEFSLDDFTGRDTIENITFIPNYCPMCGRKFKED